MTWIVVSLPGGEERKILRPMQFALRTCESHLVSEPFGQVEVFVLQSHIDQFGIKFVT